MEEPLAQVDSSRKVLSVNDAGTQQSFALCFCMTEVEIRIIQGINSLRKTSRK